MKTPSTIKYIIPIVVLALFAGFAPRAEASWLSRGWDKVVDTGKKVVDTVVDTGGKIVDVIKPIFDKGKSIIDKIVEPVLDYAKSGKWKELLGLIGTIIGGGGTAGPTDTGGSGGGSGGRGEV